MTPRRGTRAPWCARGAISENYNIDNGRVNPRRKVIQNDDHDTQYADYRGLTESGRGCVLTEGCAVEKHRAFEVALFQKPYDVADNANDAPIRMVLSSFYTRYGNLRLKVYQMV